MAPQDFNNTYTELHPRIYRLALNIVGSREDAEDVVQDLYEKLWHKRLLVGLHQNPGGYILAAARNMCLDRLRGRKQTVEVPPTMAGETGERNEDVLLIVRRLMAMLPEKQRTAMHLRDVEELEIDEIAAIMQTRAEAVRMSLSRAHTTVKEQLTKIMNYGT